MLTYPEGQKEEGGSNTGTAAEVLTGSFPLQKGSVPNSYSIAITSAALLPLIFKMSNIYTEKLKPVIIGLIEEGEFTLLEIAKICNVSVGFVSRVKNNYDSFYSDQKI